MITAKVVKKQGRYYSFSCSGHAEYDDYGKDIVCAAVSMIVINTANAIDSLTDNELMASKESAISWEFKNIPDEKAELLMDAMLLGLDEICKKYGNEYLRLMIEEV